MIRVLTDNQAQTINDLNLEVVHDLQYIRGQFLVDPDGGLWRARHFGSTDNSVIVKAKPSNDPATGSRKWAILQMLDGNLVQNVLGVIIRWQDNRFQVFSKDRQIWINIQCLLNMTPFSLFTDPLPKPKDNLDQLKAAIREIERTWKTDGTHLHGHAIATAMKLINNGE